MHRHTHDKLLTKVTTVLCTNIYSWAGFSLLLLQLLLEKVGDHQFHWGVSMSSSLASFFAWAHNDLVIDQICGFCRTKKSTTIGALKSFFNKPFCLTKTSFFKLKFFIVFATTNFSIYCRHYLPLSGIGDLISTPFTICLDTRSKAKQSTAKKLTLRRHWDQMRITWHKLAKLAAAAVMLSAESHWLLSPLGHNIRFPRQYYLSAH